MGWLLGFPLGFGPNGIFFAMMLSFSSVAVVSGIIFRRGRWKEVAV
jgi:Na+-driven multidrug efflux pump